MFYKGYDVISQAWHATHLVKLYIIYVTDNIPHVLKKIIRSIFVLHNKDQGQVGSASTES